MNWHAALESLKQDQLQYIAIPIFLMVILLELYYDKHKDLGLYRGKDTWTSLGMLVLTGFIEFLPKVLAFIALYAIHEVSPLGDLVGRQWWAWILLFVLDDFTFYWFHRKNHEIRLLWAGHVAHHSSEYMNYGTALRQGAGERIHKYFFWLPLAFLGFDALMIFTVMSINLIYQFWVHTELVDRLPGWIEYVFNTPSHHRVHHASNIRYLDRNHGGVFILWDRLFGTFAEERKEEKPRYGLTKNIQNHNLLYVATHEYASIWKDVSRARHWIDKFKYVFKAPGWSHDGVDRRADTLRSQLS